MSNATLARWQANLPSAYAKGTNDTLTKLLRSLSVGLGYAEDDVSDFVGDTFSSTADGEGATRLALTYGIKRPPGLPDNQLMLLVQTMVGIQRGTLAAIKAVLEAATGLSGIGAYDKQDPGAFLSIPANEIWITVPADQTYGYAMWFDYDTHFSTHPVESGVFGVIHDAQDEYGGLHNDHFWGDVDVWTEELLDSVRLAGTVIIYNKTLP